MSRSLAEQIALLPEREREHALHGLDLDQLQWDWNFWGRPEQIPTTDKTWSIYLALAGRGFGKTRAGAEWIRDEAKEVKRGPKRIALVARTAADARDIVVEGDSGVLAVHPPSERPEYFPSKRKLVWPNGNEALLFTSDEPGQLRGPQFHSALADEFAAWRGLPDDVGLTAWDNLRIATRLGSNPKIFVATTPKRVPTLQKLLKEAETNRKIRIVRGSTADNASNLAEEYLEAMDGIYKGTRLGRQELLGEMLEDFEGALFSQDNFDSNRVMSVPLGLPLKIVGVDPTVAESPGDECGIIVCSSTGERDLFRRRAFVLDDQTIKGPPEVWARRVVETAEKWGAPVVAERNQGGALIKNAIHQINPHIPVFEVWSKQGKALRAEPVSLAYEQNRVKHLGFFPDLEAQSTTWDPTLGKRMKSPDRLDALVLALTALLILPPPGFGGGVLRASSPARKKLPIQRAGQGGGRGGGRRAAIYGVDLKRR